MWSGLRKSPLEYPALTQSWLLVSPTESSAGGKRAGDLCIRQQLRPLAGSILALLPPTPVAAPHLVRLNEELAWHFRLDPGMLAAPEGVEVLAGNRVPDAATHEGRGRRRMTLPSPSTP
jgi:hypothetical protein